MDAQILQQDVTQYRRDDLFTICRQKSNIYHFLKRVGDIVLSFIALIFLSPLFLIIAVFIKIEDGASVFCQEEPDEILAFCDAFRAEDKTTPLVVVPSSFNSVTETELSRHGVNIVIYANQLLRAAFPAMEEVAKSILIHHRAKEADDSLMPISQIITLIDQL